MPEAVVDERSFRRVGARVGHQAGARLGNDRSHACYDFSLRRFMMLRCLPVALMVVLSWTPAGASTPIEGGRWHAVAQPPLGFPIVSVELGEPGPYIPMSSAVIDLRAVSGDLPFDGAIGFHFEVDGKRTRDVPVISRVVLGPHQSWSFQTFVRLEGRWQYEVLPPNRELVIEWLGHDLNLRAERTVGTPPWTKSRLLRIAGPDETVRELLYLGQPAYTRAAPSLSDRAQWYAQFSAIVVPLDVWLDLRLPIREAIFGSGIHVAFFGVPRRFQAMTAIDRALIPVDFVWERGGYSVPWPYRTTPTTVVLPVSWHPGTDTRIIGSGSSPYIVVSKTAVYAADASGLSRPLPVCDVVPIQLRDRDVHLRDWPTLQELVQELRLLVVTITIVLFSFGAWIAVRRKPRIPVIVAAIVVAMGVLLVRDRITRPIPGSLVMENMTPVSSDVVQRVRLIFDYGASPIPERGQTAEAARTTVWGRGSAYERAEIRTSTTPLGCGAMVSLRDWGMTARWSARRELGRPQAIRILSRDAGKMVFEYESPIHAQYLIANWTWQGRRYRGQGRLDGANKGRAVVSADHEIWPGLDDLSWLLGFGDPSSVSWLYKSDLSVKLIAKSRDRTTVVEWNEPSKVNPHRFMMRGVLRPESDGTLTCAFALPKETRPGKATLAVTVEGVLQPVKQIRISGAGGSVTVSPTPRPGSFYANKTYDATPDALQRVAPEGGVLQIAVEPGQGVDPSSLHVWIVVSEGKS
jgi:hypothetical protein